MSGKLFIVGTPIGNLGDFSPRAIEVLSSVDFIAAEDTRVSIKLLNHFNIDTPLVSYHEHNKAERTKLIIERLKNGEKCGIVTDAGMPAISDPGEDLVHACRENGIEVESVPGPSALITALAASGMHTGRFCFEGFLSVNKQSRREHLLSLKNEKRTMIFYEAPHKLKATLSDMLSVFGEREIALCRELTKIHETVINTTLKSAVELYETEEPRGEYVLVIAGNLCEDDDNATIESAVMLALRLVKDGKAASYAAKEAAGITGFKKSEIYSRMIERM